MSRWRASSSPGWVSRNCTANAARSEWSTPQARGHSLRDFVISSGDRFVVASLEEEVLSGWGDFAAVMGTATGALVGLLFVAVSIQVETIAKSPRLRNRSAQTLTLLLTGLLVAALLTIPDQPQWALGAEFLALALFVAGVTLMLNRWAGSPSGRIERVLDVMNPTLTTSSLLVVGAVILILGHTFGIYFLVPALILVLVGGVVNAWLILVKIPD